MHVVATAGHVDHGKSALVQALTGTDPDRLAEEHRRGLSIELGYCWTSLPDFGEVAFVDVPGHERFVPTMLAGVGPVPAVLFVVAADDPWMPQADEHLRVLDGLGIAHGVLAVTRCDLAEPGPTLARARAELARTSLRDAATVAVSARTGEGLAELSRLLGEMVRSLPSPDHGADVRLWLDRSFHMRGAGTVVTGTLSAGRVRVGDVLSTGTGLVRVRGLQSLGGPVTEADAVARVALNVVGEAVDGLSRGDVLVTPDAWSFTELADVRVVGDGLPEQPLLHVGAAQVATHARPLADDLVRLRLEHALPLRIGDRALLRDPGSRQVWGLSVLDPAPEPLRRRGAARVVADELARLDGVPSLAAELRRRRLVRLSRLKRLGVDVREAADGAEGIGVVAGDWAVSDDHATALRRRLEELVREHDQRHPLDPGLPVAEAANALALPSTDLVSALVCAPMTESAGRVEVQRYVGLPDDLETALSALERDLSANPYAAPTADRLRALGVDAPAAAAAARAGRLLRVGDGIVLLPGADESAVTLLGELPQPFTTGQARARLGTSRRVVLPLLAHLDRLGHTRRLPDDRRTTEPRGGETHGGTTQEGAT